MIPIPKRRSQRLLYLLTYIVLGALLCALLSSYRIHSFVGGTILLLAGLGLCLPYKKGSGVFGLYLFTAIVTAFAFSNTLRDIWKGEKATLSVSSPTEPIPSDAYIIRFVDAHVEKEKYGHYLYSYRGHRSYFAAPVVSSNWTPAEPVQVWAVIEVGDTLYDSLIYGDNESEEQATDSLGYQSETEPEPVSIDPLPQANGIYFSGWNDQHKQGLIVNDDELRYLDAVKDAALKHRLTVSENPVLINWIPNPAEELKTQLNSSLSFSALLLVAIAIWFAYAEKKIQSQVGIGGNALQQP